MHFAIVAILCCFAFSACPPPADENLGPDGMAFYTPPSPLPNGSNGDLIWYRPVTVTFGPEVNAYTVLYQSQDALHAVVPVTGTVIVPTAEWTGDGDRPMIIYAVGTHGLSQDSAPSLQIQAGTDYEISNYVTALNEGYALLITDNPGYTTGKTPPYMAGITQALAALDIAKAALQIPSIELVSSAATVIWGYSQGGQTAAFAGQLQPAYAPNINLVGVAAGGVPADFFQVAEYLDGNNGSAFLLMTVMGLYAQYPDGIPLMELVNDAGEAAMAKAKQQGVFETLFDFMNIKLSTYVKGNTSLDDLLAMPSVHDTLAMQTLGNTPINVPVLLYHGTADQFIPLEQSLQLKEKYCGLGVNTTYLVFPGDHITTQFQGAKALLPWMKRRFEGRVQFGTCGSTDARPVSTSNPVEGDFIVSLNEWHLDAMVHLKKLNNDIFLPDSSTFSAETNMTTQIITGDLYVPEFVSDVWIVIIPSVTTMTIESTEPMVGTASIDKDGLLHVHGILYVNIGLEGFDGIQVRTQTVTPVPFYVDYDGPVAALGDGTLTFSGTTTYPALEGDYMENVLTTFMSGPDQTYSFTVFPWDPIKW